MRGDGDRGGRPGRAAGVRQGRVGEEGCGVRPGGRAGGGQGDRTVRPGGTAGEGGGGRVQGQPDLQGGGGGGGQEGECEARRVCRETGGQQAG